MSITSDEGRAFARTRPENAERPMPGNGAGNGHEHEEHLTPVNEIAATQEDRRALIELAVRDILIQVGEDPEREGLIRTPYRVAKAYFELLEGYEMSVAEIIGEAMFDVEFSEGEMVVVANIPYSSLCEHHMLPFVGKAHVAYIPQNRVVGLSKIPRIVDMFSRRLQVQERLTNEIASVLEDYLKPAGVMVMVEGQHSCAALRGVRKHDMNMVTTARRGLFRSDRTLVDDFYRNIGR